MRGRKRVLSFILAFSMIMSLFAGQVVVDNTAKAADGETIVLNTLQKSVDGKSYTYPNAEVQINDATKKFYNLTIAVDSGHMMTDLTALAGVAGYGILSGNTTDIAYSVITTTDKYEAITFELAEGATKAEIEAFIRQIRFTTAKKVQTVSMSASTRTAASLKTEIGGEEIELKYFNGHYYGYVKHDLDWTQAYAESKTATFNGVQGYLLTLTSRAEDRFILLSFGDGNDYAPKGWMGCTRATLAEGSSYDVAETEWNELPSFTGDNYSDFVWRWVSGPEKGQEFGYQNDAAGYDWSNGNDGGFVTDPEDFSNWQNGTNGNGNIEPNGGASTNPEEAFGFFGKYKYGKWNDNPNVSWEVDGYYIEFGGNAGDDEKFEESLDQIIVTTEETTDEIITDGTYTEDKVTDLSGTVSIIPNKRDGEAGTILTADIADVEPEVAQSGLTYQWYTVEGGVETPIDGATHPTYTTTEADKEKTFVVKVTGSDAYPGTLTSPELIPITDVVAIVNNTKDDNGNEIVKAGSVLSADITGVNPEGSHDTLTYQWYTVEGGVETPIDGATYKNYTLTADDIDKDIVVKVTGNGNYYNTLASTPYDATRTDADITIDEPADDPTEPDTPEEEKKLTITVDPTMQDYVYTLQKANGDPVDPTTEMVVVDGEGNALTPEDDGYYDMPAGSIIKFTELDPDGTYVIVKKKKDTDETGTGGIVGPVIPDSEVDTEYDDKDTEDVKDDTITIIVDPALTDAVYAVRKEEDGTYVDIPIKKDADGNYVPEAGGSKVWSDGNEGKVVFTNLPANGTYKVVAKSSDGTITDVTPEEIIGGSQNIVGEDSKPTTSTPDPTNPTAAPTAAPSVVPPVAPTGTPAAPSETPIPLDKKQEDNVTKFIKEHATNPKGGVVKEITDLTRDIITSGESDWKKLSATEKAAVNQRLKAGGSKYTYEQLLKMAKSYKIPGFKVIKFMKKNSKAKLKLIKCKGATIVCTSTNKKVATVNKKGVIKAKKVGRATLTFTAIKGKYTNRLVIDVRVKKKFKNAKELTNFKSKVIKTPTVLVAKKRLLKKSSKISVYDLVKTSKVTFTPIKKKILTINKKGKYTGKKRGSTLVRVNIKQNGKTYLLYVYVTIY